MIGIITTIIICKKRKKPSIQENNGESINSSTNNLTGQPTEVSKPPISNAKTITIHLVTTSQTEVKIEIDPEKTVKELIQLYFEKSNRPDLFGDPTIRFLMNAKLLEHESNELIKNYISKENGENVTIVIDDLEDKLN